MEPLKEIYNTRFLQRLAAAVKAHYPSFDASGFVTNTAAGLPPLSLNERMRHIAVSLQGYLPDRFQQSVQILEKAIVDLPTGYGTLVLPDFVSQFGLQHYDRSMKALEWMTRFGSAEFAVREFLKADFQKGLTIMEQWAKQENTHVRRLASEGSRPRLPWSFKLDAVIENPGLTKGILEQLKNDKELYVKKSVANHLNDISKDNPDFMLAMLRKWDLEQTHTAWIAKHASRSLIKKGDPAVLKIFRFEKQPAVKVSGFKLHKSRLKLGDTLEFSFQVISEKNKAQKLVIDYKIHYKRQTGTTAKVFKLKEYTLPAGAVLEINKKQLIKDFSTRKHLAGEHAVEILINGLSYGKLPFQLITSALK